MRKKTAVHYWSDILCVWAYVGQVRANELAANFAAELTLKNLYFSVFGAANTKLDSMWASKGGRVAYNQHVREIVARFGHLTVTSDKCTTT